MKCVTSEQMNVIDSVLYDYDLTDSQYSAALTMVEERACDTSMPFIAYSAAHTAASIAKRQYK